MRIGLIGVKQKALSQVYVYDLIYLDSEDNPIAGPSGISDETNLVHLDGTETITGSKTFTPPLVGTLDEVGNSDASETVPITATAQGSGTPVVNVLKWDGTPVDDSGYGVSHLDSDGGGGFAGGAIAFSEHGNLIVNVDSEQILGSAVAVMDLDSTTFDVQVGTAWVLTASARAADQTVATFNPYTGATADAIVVIDSEDGATKNFRVRPNGEVHARGGVVLYSPNGTAYRLKVANDGTLSTEAV